MKDYCNYILEEHSILRYSSNSNQYKPSIYVCAPVYRKNSNGVRILYELSEIIRQNGFNSKVLCYEDEIEGSNEYVLPIPTRYNSHLIKLGNKFRDYEINDEDIVIYSEIISDNPLRAKNVVRYLLNRPSYITGHAVEYGQNDYLVSYSLSVDSNLPQMFILNDDRAYFYPIDFCDKEDLVCIYYGKVIDPEIRDVQLKDLISTFKQKIVITREFPKTRKELGQILRRSRLLVSLDPISSISYEATLCSTPSLIVGDIFGFANQKFNIPLYGMINSPTQYDEAIKDVKLAFNQYKKALEENQTNVAIFISSVVQHFTIMNSDFTDSQMAMYRQVIYSRNSSQSELDKLRYASYMKSRGFSMNSTNLDYLSPLGRKLKNLLVAIGLKYLFIKPYIHIKQWIQDNKFLSQLFYKL